MKKEISGKLKRLAIMKCSIWWVQVSYTLTALSKSQLGRDRKELVPSEILGMYQASTTLLELVCPLSFSHIPKLQLIVHTFYDLLQDE